MIEQYLSQSNESVIVVKSKKFHIKTRPGPVTLVVSKIVALVVSFRSDMSNQRRCRPAGDIDDETRRQSAAHCREAAARRSYLQQQACMLRPQSMLDRRAKVTPAGIVNLRRPLLCCWVLTIRHVLSRQRAGNAMDQPRHAPSRHQPRPTRISTWNRDACIYTDSLFLES